MRPRSILSAALVTGLLPDHLYGETQHKTLHARLSEDIATHREESRFFRTSPGVFFLRRFQADLSIPESHRTEYLAPPRRKELKRDWVLSVRAPAMSGKSDECYEISLEKFNENFATGKYKYSPYSVIIDAPEIAAVHSFVVVHKDQLVLSYRTGRFSPTSDPLFGQRSVGVGGAVIMGEHDFLYDSMYGIIGNGIAELGFAIGLPRRFAEAARYNNELQPLAVVVVPRSRRHPNTIYVVLAYRCPDDFTPVKSALSINDLRWINPRNPGNSLESYDATSRLLLNDRRLDFIEDARKRA